MSQLQDPVQRDRAELSALAIPLKDEIHKNIDVKPAGSPRGFFTLWRQDSR